MLSSSCSRRKPVCACKAGAMPGVATVKAHSARLSTAVGPCQQVENRGSGLKIATCLSLLSSSLLSANEYMDFRGEQAPACSEWLPCGDVLHSCHLPVLHRPAKA